MRYLKGTSKLGITFRRSDQLVLEAMCDADFAGEPQENKSAMRSTNGIVLFLKGIGPICWLSSLQTTIATSTAEAEYKCLGVCGKMVMAERYLLAELGFPQVSATVVHEDNNACITIAQSHYTSSNMRHVNINHHYIRELIEQKSIAVTYCPSNDMVADILTKAEPVHTFLEMRDILLNKL
jgi:hypothetical protein